MTSRGRGILRGSARWAVVAAFAVPAAVPAAAQPAIPEAPPAKAPASPPTSPPAPVAPQRDPLQSRIRKFFYPHDKDGKRIAIVEAEWAILREQDSSHDHLVVDLIQPTFTLFRDVENSSQREKILLRGATGLFDKGAQRARLEGQVTVQQSDGAELRTERLDLDLDADRHADGEGRDRRLTTDSRVELLKPGLTLTGVGLEASEGLHVATVRSGVILNVRGSLGGLLKESGGSGAAAGGPAVETTLTCEGPASIRLVNESKEGGGSLEEVRLSRNVSVTRHEPAGLMRLNGDAATLDLRHGPAAPVAGTAGAGATASPARTTEVRRAVIIGHVQLVDTQGLSGAAHRLVWSAAEDRLEMEDEAGVRVARGAYSMQGKRVVLLRQEARADCRGDARVVFVPEGVGGERATKSAAPDKPWVIQSESLAVRFSADMKGLDGVDAAGHVTIATEGEPAAGGPAAAARFSAAGDRFVWEAPARRGFLTGAPVVLGQGGHRMEAARVVFFPLDQRVVLQGPKRIEFAGAAPAPATASAPAAAAPESGIVLSSRGDVAVAAGDGVIDIGDGAIVLTPQTRLETDRLRLLLAPDGGGIQRALGWGHVRLSDRVSGTGVFGDHLEWDVKAQEFVVEGIPFAYILQKGGRLQGQAITITRQPDGLRCANRSGLRGRIQVGTPELKP